MSVLTNANCVSSKVDKDIDRGLDNFEKASENKTDSYTPAYCV